MMNAIQSDGMLSYRTRIFWRNALIALMTLVTVSALFLIRRSAAALAGSAEQRPRLEIHLYEHEGR